MKSTLTTVMTFMGSVVVGCGAAIAIASAAAVSREAPSLRTAPARPEAVEAIRLEPIVVTISRDRFDALRKQQPVESKMAEAGIAKAKSRG